MVRQRLRQLRRMRGLTLDQLAEVSGINRGTIHRIELGQVSPRLSTLELLCQALGTDLSGLFESSPEGTVAASGSGTGRNGDFRQGVLDWLGHLEALFHHSADGFAVVDAEGYICFESQVSMRLRGDSPHGRLSRPWFHSAHPEDLPALQDGMAEVLRQVDEPRNIEYRVPAGEGAWRWVRATLRNQMEHPAIRGIVLNIQDITDWKASQAQQRRIERLESQLQVLQAITAEFSNLWMGFQGHLEAARLGDAGPREVSGFQESLARGSRLLHQMRDICGHPLVERRPVDLNPLIEAHAGRWVDGRAAEGRLHLSLDPSLPKVQGDPELLERLVGHLLDHLDSMPDRSPATLRISTSRLDPAGAEAAGLGFEAREDGPGFVLLTLQDADGSARPETLGDPLDHLVTTGLADWMLPLTAAARTVRDHGGILDQSWAPESGLSLRVVLPVARDLQAPRSLRVDRSGKVLVVDDESFVLSALEQMIAAMGLEFLGASDGQVALDLLAQHRDGIRLVLLDLNMPGVDGEEFLQAYRRMGSDIPVILCTGAAALPDADERRLEGVAGILRKPFRFEDLRRAVEAAMA